MMIAKEYTISGELLEEKLVEFCSKYGDRDKRSLQCRVWLCSDYAASGQHSKVLRHLHDLLAIYEQDPDLDISQLVPVFREVIEGCHVFLQEEDRGQLLCMLHRLCTPLLSKRVEGSSNVDHDGLSIDCALLADCLTRLGDTDLAKEAKSRSKEAFLNHQKAIANLLEEGMLEIVCVF